MAARDVYQILREAIGRTGRVALSRIVIGQRERVIALRLYEKGLAAHTLHEQRDLNDASGLFDDPLPVDEEMVKLATQLVDRQTANYDPADIEDRYETRLRALIDARLKGEGIALDEVPEPEPTNVINLMAALKRSLAEGQPASNAASPTREKATKGIAAKTTKVPAAKPAPPPKSPPQKASRKRAS